MLSNLLDVYEMFRWSREPKEANVGAYIDNKSNRAVGEEAVRKSNNVGQIDDAPFPTSV
jgi:hypothetical protein